MSCLNRVVSSPLLALPVLLALVGGCGPDKGPGGLDITYVLGNNKTCDEVNVDRLSAELIPTGEDTEGQTEVREDLACSADGTIVFEGITPGLYNLEVIAYDAGDVPIFDNLGQSGTERRIEIFEAATAETESELTARPVDFGVAWALGPNGLSNCAGVGIDNFEISAFQAGGGTVLLETTLDCELTGEDDGYRTIDDPMRTLNGTLFGEVGIQAHASDGSNVGDPVTFMFDPVGPGYPVKLAIECTELGCEPLE